jgi:hypothetical protein
VTPAATTRWTSGEAGFGVKLAFSNGDTASAGRSSGAKMSHASLATREQIPSYNASNIGRRRELGREKDVVYKGVEDVVPRPQVRKISA